MFFLSSNFDSAYDTTDPYIGPAEWDPTVSLFGFDCHWQIEDMMEVVV